MLKAPGQATEFEDDQEWFERSEYWRASPAPKPQRRRKYNQRAPLVLCGHGVRIRIDRGTLLIQDGFTHYPQKRQEFRYFPGDANLPDRIIIQDASGGITFDALAWLFQQNITFVQLNWRGHVQLVGGTNGYAATAELIAAQRAAQSGKRQIEIARWLIREKIVASAVTLRETIPKSDAQRAALQRLQGYLKRIEVASSRVTLSAILGIEGAAAAAYFKSLRGISLKWSGLSKRPVPDSWGTIGVREMSWRNSAQNARHPINAMLNYGYGILISQVRSQVTAAGLDPSVGIMHGKSQNRIPLVYDLMEPLRPAVDRKVLGFALSHTFTPGDFTINQWAGCRLNPQMAKALVTTVTHGLEFEPIVSAFVTGMCRGAEHIKRVPRE